MCLVFFCKKTKTTIPWEEATKRQRKGRFLKDHLVNQDPQKQGRLQRKPNNK